jgi:hypothetical protein
VLHPQVSGLHSHAAQRLVGLTSLLARRWLKLSQAMASSAPNQDMQVRARQWLVVQLHQLSLTDCQRGC